MDADSEQEIEALEAKFPELADVAFAAARERVLASGQSVLQTIGGTLYEVFPDCRLRAVKQVAARVPMASGSCLVIK
jgi:hypothetical protein